MEGLGLWVEDGGVPLLGAVRIWYLALIEKLERLQAGAFAKVFLGGGLPFRSWCSGADSGDPYMGKHKPAVEPVVVRMQLAWSKL